MKKLLLLILVLAIIVFGAWFYFNQPVPEGSHDQKTTELADKMLDAIGMKAWEKIPYVHWAFRGKHHYTWDKHNHFAQIKWDDYEVKMNLKKADGAAYESGNKLEGDDADEAIKKAWDYWCNDSFWLNAPSKIYDPGTSLSLVKLDDGSEGLKVKYNTGGVTPGDSYLWVLDENGLPKYFKMWVSIIPVGGVKATWTDWKTLDGAKISTLHEMGPMSITIDDLKVGNNLNDMGLDSDYFSEISK